MDKETNIKQQNINQDLPQKVTAAGMYFDNGWNYLFVSYFAFCKLSVEGENKNNQQ